MKRRQVVAFLDCCQHVVCDHCGRSELLAAMYDTVTNCVYLAQIFDRAGLVIYQCVEHQLDRLFVCGHRSLCDLLVQSCFLIGQPAVNADSLAETFCQNGFCVGINQLIFQ